MTVTGAGGLKFGSVRFTDKFQKDRKKLDASLRKRLDEKIRDLFQYPIPPGLRFEKLQGYRNPDIYTFHVTGNYKVSLTINGDVATLRRVRNHNDIDRQP